jgi:hypothetical protein
LRQKVPKVKPDVQTRNIGVLDAPDARDIIRAALTTAMRMWEISRLPTDQSAAGRGRPPSTRYTARAMIRAGTSRGARELCTPA